MTFFLVYILRGKRRAPSILKTLETILQENQLNLQVDEWHTIPTYFITTFGPSPDT